MRITQTKRFSCVDTAHQQEQEDRAASSVQGLFKVFRARREYAAKYNALQAENFAKNIQAPFVPTPQPAVDAFCQHFLQDKEEEVVLDLGCGDGRVVLQAVRTGKASQGVGVDIQPEPLARAEEQSSECAVHWILGDFKDERVVAWLPKVTVCFLFLLPTLLADIAVYLVRHLRVGARICLYTFDFPPGSFSVVWRPSRQVKVDSLGAACMLWEYTVTDEVKARLTLL